MKAKSPKGSITLFVLIALFFYMGFLLLLYAANTNKVQTVSEKLNLIKSIYEKNIEKVEEVYNRKLAQRDDTEPYISDLPSKIIINNIDPIITNVTKIDDSYVEYGSTGGKTEFYVFNQNFASLKAVIEYAKQNNMYGTYNIDINAYGNNGKMTNKTESVEIIKGAVVTNEQELTTALGIQESLYISITNNIECVNTIQVENITHTLDLNNNSVSFTKQNESFTFITITSNAKLTILDSSNQKNGVLLAKLEETSESDGNARNNTVICIKNDGELILQSGTVQTATKQIITNAKSSTAVTNTGTAVENIGTMTLNGGMIYTNVETQACSHLAVRRSTANARGITNNGTVNLEAGSITTNATATLIRSSGATVWGKTYAFAYGILGKGTIYTNENVTFTTTATANKEGTYKQDSEALDISKEEKVIVDDDE